MGRFLRGFLLIGVLGTLLGCVEPPPEAEPPQEGQRTPDQADAARLALRDQLLHEHHRQCVELFVKTEGNGYGRMVVLTHPSPNYPKSLDLPDSQGQQPWIMDRVELISLLKGRDGVYPAMGMKNTGALLLGHKPVKTRDMDAFESRSLERLRAGEELEVSATADHLRMVGAIRAQNACLGCHADHKEGDLLGAFTYHLKPAR